MVSPALEIAGSRLSGYPSEGKYLPGQRYAIFC
jgi:hypothetical protein